MTFICSVGHCVCNSCKRRLQAWSHCYHFAFLKEALSILSKFCSFLCVLLSNQQILPKAPVAKVCVHDGGDTCWKSPFSLTSLFGRDVCHKSLHYGCTKDCRRFKSPKVPALITGTDGQYFHGPCHSAHCVMCKFVPAFYFFSVRMG